MPKGLDFTLPTRMALDSPYLADYFGIWLVDADQFRQLVNRVNGVNLHAHLQSAEVKQAVEDRDQRLYPVTSDGIAQLRIDGVMMKSVPSLTAGTSTVRMRQQLRLARRDPEVRGAMLVMDTPGGTAKGNPDLAEEVAAFAAAKPIYAFVEDMAASAGVSIASQATKRYANNVTAIYGSMGTYSVIEDLSGAAELLGVKVHVIKAGEFKGMGEPGTQVTDAQIAEAQRIVNGLNESYLALIARGTGLPVEEIRKLADGRAIFARDAVTAGLLHGVQSYEATYAELVAATAKPRTKGPLSKLSSQTRSNAMDPVSLADLKKAFPNSTAEWRESQLEAGADMQTAAVAYASFIETQSKKKEEDLQKQLDELKAGGNKPPKGKANPVGHKALKARSAAEEEGGDDEEEEAVETGDPIGDFNQAVARAMGRGPITLQRRQAAIRTVISRHPDLYRAYMLACNPGKRQQRLIEEKLEAAAAQ